MSATALGKSVLVTGVSRDLGRRFARSLAQQPGVAKVIGVDVVPPRGDIGDVSFVRADIRTPVIAKVLAKEDIDTVVHMSIIATPGSTGGRNTMKELNVIGTMQLLAACQKAEAVERLVVKSTTTVYGASNRDPAMFTEDMEPRRSPRAGYAKDVAEVEGYVRGFARRRPDVSVAVLRCANVIGRHVISPMTSYLRLPVIPTVLGFDARMQFLHENDLFDVMHHAVATDAHGTYNVAGDGILMLSQAVRRLHKPSVPMPGFAVGRLGSVLRSARLADFSPEQIGLLTYGRGVDTTRMVEQLGFVPSFSTEGALNAFITDLGTTAGPTQRALESVAERLPSYGTPELATAQPAKPASRPTPASSATPSNSATSGGDSHG